MILGVLNACMAGLVAPPAYPIPPRPLRLLVQEAEFIVVARVRHVDARSLSMTEE